SADAGGGGAERWALCGGVGFGARDGRKPRGCLCPHLYQRRGGGGQRIPGKHEHKSVCEPERCRGSERRLPPCVGLAWVGADERLGRFRAALLGRWRWRDGATAEHLYLW